MGYAGKSVRVIVLIVLGSLLGFTAWTVAQEQLLYVKPGRANVRMNPAIEPGNIVAVLPRGASVTAFEPEAEWYPIQLPDGRTGWMHASVLTAQRPTAAPAAPAVEATRLPVLQIGMVQDGPWGRHRQVLGLFWQEIVSLLDNEYTVRFPPDATLHGAWTATGVRAAMDRLLHDPQIDVILALGVLASSEAGRRGALPKPVFAPFIIDATLQGIPSQEGASGVTNFGYLSSPTQLAQDLRVFRSMVPFHTFTLLVSQGLRETVPTILNSLRQEAAALGLTAHIVAVGASVDDALAALPAETQAVYITPLVQLAPDAFARLLDGLRARKLPSFSYWGRSEVEQGVLTSRYLDTDFGRRARRVALDVQRALGGEDPGTFPVTFTRGERLTLNMATARAIGVSPPWDIITQAEQLDRTIAGVTRSLSLARAVREAVVANLDLAALGYFVAAGKENMREARSVLLPQADAALLGLLIDEDRAAASFGSQAERTLSGSLTLSQLVYSESAWANLRIQGHLQASREEQRHATLLDVALEAAVGYLTVLSAKTIEQIRRDNLNLTRTNLELARVRQSIGVARAAEVLRWESQIANDRRNVISAFSQRQQAEIALNRVLHRPLEERFMTEEPELDSPELLSSFGRIFPYVDNPQRFEGFRAFMVQEGLAAAPELRQFDAQLAAQQRGLLSAQRSFWSPTVVLEGNVTGQIAEGGAGTDVSLGEELPIDLPRSDAVDWQVGLQASLPLVTGGARVAIRNRAQAELAQVQVQRAATAERIATRIRTTLYAAGASYVSIRLAQEAARAAQQNLDLVVDAYGRGAVSILDLLDAQTEALTATLNAANATYAYLIDLMHVQRAAGQFDFFVSESGRQAWFERLNAFFRHQGVTVEQEGR